MVFIVRTFANSLSIHISGFSTESYESALSTATSLLALMTAVSLAVEIVTAVVW